jgi:predicted ATPase
MARLVSTGLVFRRGAPTRTSYIFKHALVQDAAYHSLLNSRRQQLHARIAQILEERFPETARAKPELLAHHFDQAGLVEKAVEYHEQAGRRAIAQSAVSEALAHFGSALDRLQSLPRSRDRLRRELGIHLALGSGHVAVHGFAARATGDAYRRASELCKELGETKELFPVLYGLCLYHLYGAELTEAQSVAEHLLKLVETTEDRGLLFFAHQAAGVSSLPAGDFVQARFHLEQALALYDPGEHRTPAFVYAFDLPDFACGRPGRRFWAAGHSARQAIPRRRGWRSSEASMIGAPPARSTCCRIFWRSWRRSRSRPVAQKRRCLSWRRLT